MVSVWAGESGLASPDAVTSVGSKRNPSKRSLLRDLYEASPA